MSSINALLDEMWESYISYTPSAAKIAKLAHKNGTTLKEEAIKLNLISEKEFLKIVDPKKMTKPS